MMLLQLLFLCSLSSVDNFSSPHHSLCDYYILYVLENTDMMDTLFIFWKGGNLKLSFSHWNLSGELFKERPCFRTRQAACCAIEWHASYIMKHTWEVSDVGYSSPFNLISLYECKRHQLIRFFSSKTLSILYSCERTHPVSTEYSSFFVAESLKWHLLQWRTWESLDDIRCVRTIRILSVRYT